MEEEKVKFLEKVARKGKENKIENIIILVTEGDDMEGFISGHGEDIVAMLLYSMNEERTFAKNVTIASTLYSSRFIK